VVTALEFRLYPIATAYAGFLAWDWSRAEAVLRRYADWAPGQPDEVTTAFRILQLPPIPELPEAVRGRQIAIIDGAILADDAIAERILAPLRELSPEIDTFRRVPASSLIRLHLDPEGPTPGVGDGAILGWLAPAGVDALLSVAGPDSGTPLLIAAELRQLGGALGRNHPGAGALPRLHGQYVLFALGVPMSPEDLAVQTAHTRRVRETMAPFANGKQYLNLTENPIDMSTGFDERSWARLRQIRAQVDLTDLFVSNHRVPVD
jgi:hypothetical protein